ncbi:MAG TPA: DUF2326 domain-containing protein [Candidatus Eremiobacteraeota bacterium]|mgnify:CR=1 FL=1|nr:DUF2326 domain-containing protein [Candidatus Eremiobacteraeota bacterium]
MIKSVRSNNKNFKEVHFDTGLNIILAERIRTSTDKDSRNGLGKTTLIEIIHFCLGANIKENEGLGAKELANWTFILELKLRGKDYTIYRNTTNSGIIKIEGDFSDWPIKPEYNIDEKVYFLLCKEWINLLGYLIFDLPLKKTKEKYMPTFRSLISYFIRRDVGAFQEPFKHCSQQKEWDIQANNAYLLGLNWEYASEFQIVKDKGKTLDELKKASEQGLLTGYIGSLGELEAEKVRLEAEINKIGEELKTFKVHPQYYAIQEEANKLTREIHETTNDMTLNQLVVNKYKESITEEKDISIEKVTQVYHEAGLLFSDRLINTLGDVINFHEKIIENRRDYLQTEIDRISKEIEKQKLLIEQLSNKRSDLLEILNSHGALEEYFKLQDRAITFKEQLKEINNRKTNLKKFKEGKSSLKIAKEELFQKTFRDYEERRLQIEKAIKYFDNNSKSLYSESGTLSIDPTETGYKYKVDIKRARSQGIGYMKVFCYDLTLSQLRAQYKDMPGFLIHDSTIFDGVDERQIAKALELAAFESKEKGFQYICALNSDIVPYNDFSESFKSEFDKYIKIKFTDATDDGGLLGIRF